MVKISGKFLTNFVVLLMVNFGALALGAAYTDPGTSSDWYLNLPKAPWNPPGWVFGAAWTTIGITYSLMMTYLSVSTYRHLDQIQRWFWFSVTFNILWNPVFFWKHQIWMGIVILGILSYLIYNLVDFTRKTMGWKVAWLGMPYFVWLMIALSLNLYIGIVN